MAKKKEKEKELSPKDRLKNVTVPKEQWPYPLPDTWCWVRIGNITDIVSGGTPSSKKSEYYRGGNIAWICPSDLSEYTDMYISHGARNITKLGLEKSSAKLMPAGTVCLSSRAPIGYVVIAANEISTNQGFKNFLPSARYCPEYLYWYLTSNTEYLQSMASGTTFLELSASKAAQLLIPLPPLKDQLRIAELLKRNICILDNAKNRVIYSRKLLLRQRSLILGKAFSGKLTIQWRSQKNRSYSDWTTEKFQDIAIIRTNLVSPREYLDFPHIAPDNIEKGSGKLLPYHTVAEDRVISGKHLFHKGQILYSKIRPYLSKVILAEFDGLCSADMYPIDAKCNNKYLWYYMLSDRFLNQASNAGSRTVLPKINQKELNKVTVPIPSIEEQEEIVRLLDEYFSRLDNAMAMIQSIDDSIEQMKTILLRKAFRGEL